MHELTLCRHIIKSFIDAFENSLKSGQYPEYQILSHLSQFDHQLLRDNQKMGWWAIMTIEFRNSDGELERCKLGTSIDIPLEHLDNNQTAGINYITNTLSFYLDKYANNGDWDDFIEIDQEKHDKVMADLLDISIEEYLNPEPAVAYKEQK